MGHGLGALFLLAVAVAAWRPGRSKRATRYFLRLAFEYTPESVAEELKKQDQNILCSAPRHKNVVWEQRNGAAPELKHFVVWTVDAPRGAGRADIRCVVMAGRGPLFASCAVSMAEPRNTCKMSPDRRDVTLQLSMTVVPGKNIGPPAAEPPPAAAYFEGAGVRYAIRRAVVRVTAFDGRGGHWRLDCGGERDAPSLSVELAKSQWKQAPVVEYMWPIVFAERAGLEPLRHSCRLAPWGKRVELERRCEAFASNAEVSCNNEDNGLNALLKVML